MDVFATNAADGRIGERVPTRAGRDGSLFGHGHRHANQTAAARHQSASQPRRLSTLEHSQGQISRKVCMNVCMNVCMYVRMYV